jgi:hypothetical protein
MIDFYLVESSRMGSKHAQLIMNGFSCALCVVEDGITSVTNETGTLRT